MLALLLACVETTTTEVPVCEVELVSLEPASAEVGAEVLLVASPLSESWDTAVLVGGERAQLLGLSREGCDACIEDNECSSCLSDCDPCDAQCAADCTESVSFLVPELPAGPTTVELFNTHGGSQRIAFEVLDSVDTGSTDTGG